MIRPEFISSLPQPLPNFNLVSKALARLQESSSLQEPSFPYTTDQTLFPPLTLQPLMSRLPIVSPFAYLEDKVISEPGVSKAALEAVKAIPGQHWLGKLPANGNREVAVLIPQGTDLSQPVEMVYYFHGHNGTIAGSLADPQKGMAQVIQDLAKDPQRNVILVVPQGPPKAQDFTWMNPKYKESMAEFQAQAQGVIQTKMNLSPHFASVTLKGHSAGGLPLMNGAMAGMKADRLDFLDASYGFWASSAYRHQIKTNPNLTMKVVYIPGTSTAADAERLKQKPGVELIRTQTSHGKIPKAFLGK